MLMVTIEDLQWIKVSKYRLKILFVLKDKLKSPRELEKELNIKLSHISRSLSQLSLKRYVEDKTPNLGRNKLYAITKKGGEVLKKID
ncbi:hypothetical protein ES703_117825 [subsurface metagenome]